VHRAAQTSRTPNEPQPVRQDRGRLSTAFVVGLLLTLGAVGLFATWTGYQVIVGPYQTRIFPNVTVLGVGLGGLTSDEASARLTEALSDYDAGALTLSDGERSWAVPWSEAGLRFDVDATVQMAFAVGRADRGLETLLTILNVREARTAVAPVFVIDPGVARGVLEGLAPEVSVPPTDATLRLEINCSPCLASRAGRWTWMVRWTTSSPPWPIWAPTTSSP
jgi:hypothetical protein